MPNKFVVRPGIKILWNDVYATVETENTDGTWAVSQTRQGHITRFNLRPDQVEEAEADLRMSNIADQMSGILRIGSGSRFYPHRIRSTGKR